MTGFYKDYADASDTHQNSAEASATAAEQSATAAASSATAADQSAISAAASLSAQEDLEVTSASFDTTDGTFTLTRANGGTVTTDFDGRYVETSGATFTGEVFVNNHLVVSAGYAMRANLLKSNESLELRYDADNNDTTSSFVIRKDNSMVPLLGINSSDNVLINPPTAGINSRNANKLGIGDLDDTGTEITSESIDATLGIKADQNNCGIAIQEKDSALTYKLSIIDDDFVIGTGSGGDRRDFLAISPDSNGGTVGLNELRTTGDVGIGTFEPDTVLEVVDSNPILTIRDSETTGANTNATLRLAESGASDTLGNYWDINHTGNGELRFVQDRDGANNERMRIDYQGNVGIGTDPISPLHVNGTIFSEGGSFDAPDDGSDPSGNDNPSNVAFVMPRGDQIAFYDDGYVRSLLKTDSIGGLYVGQLNTSYINHIKLQCGQNGNVTVMNGAGDAALTVEGSLTASGITYPTTDGTSNQVIVTDGNGNLSFADQSEGGIASSGGTFTGDVLFNDGVKAKFGTDSDLLIYHDNNSPSIIEDAGELGLILKTNGNVFAVTSDTDESMIAATPNGGVTLYYDNEVRLNTGNNSVSIPSGIGLNVDTNTLVVSPADNRVAINKSAPSEALDVVGNIATSGNITVGGNVKFGGNDDLEIYHDATNGSIIEDKGTGGLTLITDGAQFAVGTSDSEYMLVGIPNSSTALYFNGDNKMQTTDDGIEVYGDVELNNNGSLNGRDGTVTTNIATGGNTSTSDTKTVNIGTGFANGGNTNINIGVSGTTTCTTNVNNTFNVNGTAYLNNGVEFKSDASQVSNYDQLVSFKAKNGTTTWTEAGRVAVKGSSSSPPTFVIGVDKAALRYFDGFGTRQITPADADTALGTDAICALGSYWNRFSIGKFSSGTSTTSDAREKRNIEELNEAELRVATRCKSLLRKYQRTEALELKGDDARLHFGIIAQDLEQAFSDEGLDANRYAMFLEDTWYVTEEDGEIYPVLEAVPEELRESAVQKSLKGIRYEQLLAFIIAAI